MGNDVSLQKMIENNQGSGTNQGGGGGGSRVSKKLNSTRIKAYQSNQMRSQNVSANTTSMVSGGVSYAGGPNSNANVQKYMH